MEKVISARTGIPPPNDLAVRKKWSQWGRQWEEEGTCVLLREDHGGKVSGPGVNTKPLLREQSIFMGIRDREMSGEHVQNKQWPH